MDNNTNQTVSNQDNQFVCRPSFNFFHIRVLWWSLIPIFLVLNYYFSPYQYTIENWLGAFIIFLIFLFFISIEYLKYRNSRLILSCRGMELVNFLLTRQFIDWPSVTFLAVRRKKDFWTGSHLYLFFEYWQDDADIFGQYDLSFLTERDQDNVCVFFDKIGQQLAFNREVSGFDDDDL